MECVADVIGIDFNGWNSISQYSQGNYLQMIPPQLQPKRLWRNRVPINSLAITKTVEKLIPNANSHERIVSMKGGFMRSGHDGKRLLMIAGKISHA